MVDGLGFWLYNCIMETRKATLKKTRAHVVLFCAGTPFKQKRVELKTRYQRQPKHRGKHDIN